MYSVIVSFEAEAGCGMSLEMLLLDQARNSLLSESKCRQFDVIKPVDEQARFLLYELYEDASAFESHLRTPHFLAFEQRSAPFIKQKSIIQGPVICKGASD